MFFQNLVHAQRFKYPIATYPLTLGAGIDGITLNADTTESVGSNLVTDSGFDAVTETNSYTSDFSADADGWASIAGITVTGNIDTDADAAGQPPSDDWLRLVCSADTEQHYIARAATEIAAGEACRVRFHYYLPSTNSNVDKVYFRIGTGGLVGPYDTTNTDVAVDTYVNATVAGTIRLYLYDGIAGNFQDAGGDDVLYVKNVIIDAVTFTHWTAGTGWAPQATAGALTGKAQKVAGLARPLYRDGFLTIGQSERVIYTISDYSAGAITAEVGAGGAGTERSADGTYSEDIITAVNTRFYLSANDTFAGTIDNVTVRQVTNPKQNGITVELHRDSERLVTYKTVAGVSTVLDDSAITYSATAKVIALHDSANLLSVFYDSALVYSGTVSDASIINNKRHYVATGEGSGAFSVERLRTVNTYTFDFSVGVDGFAATRGVATGNIDGIGGQDDNLRYTVDSNSGTHWLYKTNVFTAGNIYRIRCDYYIPAGQSNIDGIRIDGGSSVAVIGSTLGSWVSIDAYIIHSGVATFYIYATDGGTLTFQDAGGDDVLYVRNIKIDAVNP